MKTDAPAASSPDHHSFDSKVNRAEYDAFADTYDQVLAEDWHYQAPGLCAEVLRGVLPVDRSVLDCGCGTGLSGQALADAGYHRLTGIDVAPKALALAAEKRIYETLREADLMLPLDFPDDGFDAAVCIGVLTYVDHTCLLPELCRVVHGGGPVVFTQRDDIAQARDFATFLEQMENNGLWQQADVTEPLAYLPGHPAYQTKVTIRIYTYIVC